MVSRKPPSSTLSSSCPSSEDASADDESRAAVASLRDLQDQDQDQEEDREPKVNRQAQEVRAGRKVKNMGVSRAEGRPLREQLQAKVSGSLAKRGVNAGDRWSTKPKEELTDVEQERLDRQRFNKRKWARKERERARKEMELLRAKNGQLEYKNQELRREVDQLIQSQLKLRSCLLEHSCHTGSQAKGAVRMLRIPAINGSTSKWVTLKESQTSAVISSSREISAIMDSGARFRRLPICEEPEEETTAQLLPGLVRIKGTDIVLHNGIIIGKGKGILRLSVPSATVTSATAGAGDNGVNSIMLGRYAESAQGPPSFVHVITDDNSDDQEDTVKGSSELSAVGSMASTTSSMLPSGISEPSSLYSGGFLYNELNSNKTFLQMLQENDDNANDVIMVDESTEETEVLMIDIKTEASEAGEPGALIPESVQALQGDVECDGDEAVTAVREDLARANLTGSDALYEFGDSAVHTSTSPDARRTRNRSGASASACKDSKGLKKRTKHGVLMEKWQADPERKQTQAESISAFRRVTRSVSQNSQNCERADIDPNSNSTGTCISLPKPSISLPLSTQAKPRISLSSDSYLTSAYDGGFKMPANTTPASRPRATKRVLSWPEGTEETSSEAKVFRSQSLPSGLLEIPTCFAAAKVLSTEPPKRWQVQQFEQVETEIVDSDFIADALEEDGDNASGVVQGNVMNESYLEYSDASEYTEQNGAMTSYTEVTSVPSPTPGSSSSPTLVTLQKVMPTHLMMPRRVEPAVPAEADLDNNARTFGSEDLPMPLRETAKDAPPPVLHVPDYGRVAVQGVEGRGRTDGVVVEGFGSRQAWQILCEVSSDALHGELSAERRAVNQALTSSS